MGRKPKVHRWNRWAKEEEKLRKLREQLARKQQTAQQTDQPTTAQTGQPKQTNLTKHAHTKAHKLTREKLATLITKALREDPKIKQLAEEIAGKIAQKLIAQILPDITEKVLNQLVAEIQQAVLNGATIEIRGLATWKTKDGKVKVKNHIKPKHT